MYHHAYPFSKYNHHVFICFEYQQYISSFGNKTLRLTQTSAVWVAWSCRRSIPAGSCCSQRAHQSDLKCTWRWGNRWKQLVNGCLFTVFYPNMVTIGLDPSQWQGSDVKNRWGQMDGVQWKILSTWTIRGYWHFWKRCQKYMFPMDPAVPSEEVQLGVNSLPKEVSRYIHRGWEACFHSWLWRFEHFNVSVTLEHLEHDWRLTDSSW